METHITNEEADAGLYGSELKNNKPAYKLVRIGNSIGDFFSTVIFPFPMGIIASVAKYTILFIALVGNVFGGLLGAIFGGITGGFKAGWNIGHSVSGELEKKTAGKRKGMTNPFEKVTKGIEKLKQKITKENTEDKLQSADKFESDDKVKFD